MEKINGKVILIIVWLSVIGLLVYSRFVNLDWGLPYPMHPDERNMSDAIQGLNCIILDFKNCLNPRFFAYGQLPLYLSYFFIWAVRGFRDFGKMVISFQEATLSLRIISATASIINAIVLLKIIESIIFNKFSKFNFQLFSLIIIIFSPFFIQFSHFGTTESLLMLFYSLIVYLSIRMLERRTTYEVVWLGLVSGLAIATKVSSVLFLAVPMTVFISSIKNQKLKLHIKIQKFLMTSFCFVSCTVIFMLIFSPHNLINFQEFISSIRYESDVAFGRTLVFYTRQFTNTVPILFQLVKVFPYTLGLPLGILGGLGILGLGWKDKKINLLRFAFLIYFLPTALIYAKWSRFMAPVFPLILIFALLVISNVKDQISKIHFKNQKFYFLICHFAFYILIFALIYPGITYLSIYQNPDVRMQATEWINKNISVNSYVLSETANVVDIPLDNKKNLNVVSFNFYDLDENPQLQQELKEHLKKADYIFVPSRRIFANHSKQNYPILNKYYEDLFFGKLGFTKIAEFSAGLNDEGAEETWTVFDHPIIRIYKKIKSF